MHFLLAGTAQLADIAPLAEIASLGFAFHDADEGLRVMEGPLGNAVRDQIGSLGLHALRGFWHSTAATVGSASHPIHRPDDLRGFRLRTNPGKIAVDLFKTLGANPQMMPYGEVYGALKNKSIDGASVPLGMFVSAKLHEVEPYLSLTNHSWSGSWLVANGDTLKRLPADLQTLVQSNGAKYADLALRASRAANAETTDGLHSQGVAVNAVDAAPFRAKLKTYYQEWSKTFGTPVWALLQNALGRKLA
jgi:TRAP-type C4-dicarboxylate transport system substrate-binding protein